MNLTAHKDIDAPINYVFQRISNFEAYERQALRRGAEVSRVDGNGPVTVGSAWHVNFTFRGKPRSMIATIAEITAPEHVRIMTDAKGLDAITKMNLVALSPKATRVTVSIDLSPKSLAARLLVQSMKLAKGRLKKRFTGRLDTLMGGFAADYRRGV